MHFFFLRRKGENKEKITMKKEKKSSLFSLLLSFSVHQNKNKSTNRGFAWPMIAKKEGDWYPKGLKEKDFRGLYGYQVFLAIAVFMGDGLYNLAKIGFVSARAYAEQRRKLAEAMAAQAALEASEDGGCASSSNGGNANGGNAPSAPRPPLPQSFRPTAAPSAPPTASAAARAREQAHERRVAGATRLRLMASFRRGMTALEPKRRGAVWDSGDAANDDESPLPSPSSASGGGGGSTAAALAASRPPHAPPPTDRELQQMRPPAAAAEDKVLPPASPSATAAAAAAAARPSATGLVCRRPRVPSRDDDDARARAALDDRRDEVFMRDAIPSWVGYVGYLAFGILGVTVIPLLYPACKCVFFFFLFPFLFLHPPPPPPPPTHTSFSFPVSDPQFIHRQTSRQVVHGRRGLRCCSCLLLRQRLRCRVRKKVTFFFLFFIFPSFFFLTSTFHFSTFLSPSPKPI